MKYLTKPVEVEAYQYDGDFGRLEEWLKETCQDDNWSIENLGEFVQIQIGNYYNIIDLGDWVIVRGLDIEILDSDFFHETYQPP